ncbi:MAG: ABC transporter substrate-binding protein [Alicyclobacillus sp.]|nr:ABC transporter substrate-binding protein [Alicyclobacillus sp.]
MKLNKSVMAVALLVMAGGVLTACGNTGGGNNSAGQSGNAAGNASNAVGSAASNATGGSQAGSSGSSSGDIVIAVAAPFSGNESFIGPRFLNGVKVAVQEINADGGVLGHQLKIVTADTAGDPVDAVPAISQIISTQHPAAMIGPSSLTITSVIQQLNSDQLVTDTLGGTTQLDKMNFKYIFRTTPSDSQLGVAMAYYGNHKGYKKVALAFTSDDAAQTLVPPIEQEVQAHGGQVVANVQLAPDQSSYRSEIEKILASKPDVVYTQMDPQTAGTFISEWQQLGGGNIPFIGSDVTAAADFQKAVTPAWSAQHLTSIQGSTQGGTAATEYAQFYEQVFNGQQPVTLSNDAYDGMNIIALAMLEAKSTDPTKYVDYIMKVANGPGTKVYDFKTGAADIAKGESINYEGAGGPDDFNQYHNVTGAFEAVQNDGNGNEKSLAQITPQQLLGY